MERVRRPRAPGPAARRRRDGRDCSPSAASSPDGRAGSRRTRARCRSCRRCRPAAASRPRSSRAAIRSPRRRSPRRAPPPGRPGSRGARSARPRRTGTTPGGLRPSRSRASCTSSLMTSGSNVGRRRIAWSRSFSSAYGNPQDALEALELPVRVGQALRARARDSRRAASTPAPRSWRSKTTPRIGGSAMRRSRLFSASRANSLALDDLEVPEDADESREHDHDHGVEQRRAPPEPLLALVLLQLPPLAVVHRSCLPWLRRAPRDASSRTCSGWPKPRPSATRRRRRGSPGRPRRSAPRPPRTGAAGAVWSTSSKR